MLKVWCVHVVKTFFNLTSHHMFICPSTRMSPCWSLVTSNQLWLAMLATDTRIHTYTHTSKHTHVNAYACTHALKYTQYCTSRMSVPWRNSCWVKWIAELQSETRCWVLPIREEQESLADIYTSWHTTKSKWGAQYMLLYKKTLKR